MPGFLFVNFFFIMNEDNRLFGHEFSLAWDASLQLRLFSLFMDIQLFLIFRCKQIKQSNSELGHEV